MNCDATTPTPNGYNVMAFTPNGPRNRGTFATEAEARAAYDAEPSARLAAMVLTDLAAGPRGGQTTVWSERK